jgi:acyl-CoA thioesterase-1
MKRLSFIISILITVTCWQSSSAKAAPIQIVALGASDVAGYGVGAGNAYPAQLEALLRSKGYDVTIHNAGISGNTTAQILARLDSAVPEGTSIVILGAFSQLILSPMHTTFNDARRGVPVAQTRSNVAQIISRLRARKIKVIEPTLRMLETIPRNDYEAGGIHWTAAGHALVAASLLPKVISAIRAK